MGVCKDSDYNICSMKRATTLDIILSTPLSQHFFLVTFARKYLIGICKETSIQLYLGLSMCLAILYSMQLPSTVPPFLQFLTPSSLVSTSCCCRAIIQVLFVFVCNLLCTSTPFYIQLQLVRQSHTLQYISVEYPHLGIQFGYWFHKFSSKLSALSTSWITVDNTLTESR